MSRDNKTWIAELSRDGPERESALSDLRGLLFRNLRKALSKRTGVDDSFLDDVIQDALVRILERLDQFEGRSQFLTWATTISIHLAMTELRRRRWRDVSLDEVVSNADVQVVQVIDGAVGPEAQSTQAAILETMQEVIETQLTERQRTALLAELRGMPLAEIARHLGRSRNAMYKLTYDARKKLKQGMEAAGFEADDILTAFAN